MNINPSPFILQQIVATLLVWLVSCILGGGIGFGIAYLLKLFYRAVPGLRNPLMILPWRTILFGLALPFFSPIFIYLRLLRLNSTMRPILSGVGFLLIVLAVTAAQTLDHWQPSNLAVRLTGLARTLAVACGFLLAITGAMLNWGMLYFANVYLAATFKANGFWIAFGVIAGLGLLLDLILGGVQMALAYMAQNRQKVAPAAADRNRQ